MAPRSFTLACAGVAVAVWALTGCGITNIDTSTPTTVVGDITSTTDVDIPDGVPAQLNQLIVLATGLGSQIGESGQAKHDTVADLNAIWTAARDAVATNERVIAAEVDHQIELLTDAVTKNHPADADKATLNLRQLVTSYLDRFGA
jgi:hypothetical protein